MSEANKFIASVAMEKGGPFAKFGFSKQQSTALAGMANRGGKLTPAEIDWFLSDRKNRIFANYDKLTTQQKELREGLKKAFLTDLEKAGAKGFREDADLMFKSVKRFGMVRDLFRGGLIKTKHNTYIMYPYEIAKKIYANRDKLMHEKTGVPELWPKLKKLADHYLEIYPAFQKVDVNESFALDKAWTMMPKAVKKILGGISGIGRFGTKATGKAVLHLGGRGVNFPNEVDF